ncbi:hypothetical protein ABKA04_006687 [Annulohypoxylon sp. FPYF3050]
MRMTFIAAMIIIGCWSLSQIIVGIFICDPVDGFWEKSVNSKCIPNYPQWYINAAGNIITDIVIFVLPLPVLRHLHMPRAQRLVLIGIFSLGFFTCAISVIRVKFLKLGGDFSYENVEGSSWSTTELCSGVTCSGASNQLDMKSDEKLFYCVEIEARPSDSADCSDDFTDVGVKRGSMSNRGKTSPTPPASAHVASHRPMAYYNWMKSSVITEIGTENNSKRPISNESISGAGIQVRRDVVMQKI